MKSFKNISGAASSDPCHLSEREKEVLAYLVRGYTHKAINAEPGIAPDTVHNHVRYIYKKLHVSCGKEAVTLVLKQQII